MSAANSDALSAVQPFVDSVIKSLVSEYEDKLSSKQEYLDRLVREAQDARELNEALSSQCATLRQYVHQSTIEFQHIREKLMRYEQNGMEELRKVEGAWRERDTEKQQELERAQATVNRLESQLVDALSSRPSGEAAHEGGDGTLQMVPKDHCVIGKEELRTLQSRWQQWQSSQHDWESKLEAKVELVQSIQAKMTKIEAKYNQQLQTKEEELRKCLDETSQLKSEITTMKGDLTARDASGVTAKQLEMLENEYSVKLANAQTAAAERQAKLEAKEAECSGMAAEWEGKMHTVQAKHVREVAEARAAAEESARVERDSLEKSWRGQLEALRKQAEDATVQMDQVREENDALYNQVQDLRGAIRVYCRVRPLLDSDDSDTTCVSTTLKTKEVSVDAPKVGLKSFNFDKVFDHNSTQAGVYEDMQPLIRCVLDGYNVAILAYGQTGSGKTFTMSGPTKDDDDSRGVNYRALDDLFALAKLRSKEAEYTFTVTMLEIYNEQVRDLLSETGRDPEGNSKNLEVRLSVNAAGVKSWYVPDAVARPVADTRDVVATMHEGESNRAMGQTSMNERSSRSHSVVSIQVTAQHLRSGNKLSSMLNLVDLAGSERVGRSEATGARLKEAQHINKSLSALGDVIAAYASKSNHIPFRNSKLTTLLQDSLGGRAKVCMFVHINPETDSSAESLSTLYFAQRAASVMFGQAKANAETGDNPQQIEQIKGLREELEKREQELRKLQGELRVTRASSQSSQKAVEELDRKEQELNKLRAEAKAGREATKQAQRAAEELERKETELQKLRGELKVVKVAGSKTDPKQQMLQIELNELRKEAKATSDELSKLTTQKTQVDNALMRYKSDLDNSKHEKTVLEQECKNMKKELHTLQARLRAVESSSHNTPVPGESPEPSPRRPSGNNLAARAGYVPPSPRGAAFSGVRGARPMSASTPALRPSATSSDCGDDESTATDAAGMPPRPQSAKPSADSKRKSLGVNYSSSSSFSSVGVNRRLSTEPKTATRKSLGRWV